MPCDVEIASEWRYRDPRSSRARWSSASRSRARPPTRSPALRQAQRARRADAGDHATRSARRSRAKPTRSLYTHAGPEIGVAATKTFTTQSSRCYLFALRLAELRGTLGERALGAAGRAARAAAEDREHARAPSRRPRDRRALRRQAVLLLPRPPRRPPGRLEGALKLKEISLHPRRGLRRGRDEARADRADRRADAGGLRRHRRARRTTSSLSNLAGGAGARRRRSSRSRPRATRGRRARRRRHLRPAHAPAAAAGARGRSRCSCSRTTSRDCAASTSTSRATSRRR